MVTAAGNGLTPGTLVLYRCFQVDRLSRLRTGRVVSDDARGLLLWTQPGSPTRGQRTADGRQMRSMPFAAWLAGSPRLTAGVWRGPGILTLIPPKGAYSVWWFWGDKGVFRGWYVNLEEPAVCWRDGDLICADTCDQDLDIWVRPDHSWEWKDTEELNDRLRFPEHYWVPDPEAVWAEGRRIVPTIEAGEFPFDGSFCDFEPDRRWRVPGELPDGWDRPRMR